MTARKTGARKECKQKSMPIPCPAGDKTRPPSTGGGPIWDAWRRISRRQMVLKVLKYDQMGLVETTAIAG